MALTCALSSALLEKLVRGAGAQRIRMIRQECLRMVDEDAKHFAQVLEAIAANDRVAFVEALKTATEIPCRLHARSHQLLRIARRSRATIDARYRVDLACVIALATASGRAAQALVRENLRWLGDRTYARRIMTRVRQAATHDRTR